MSLILAMLRTLGTIMLSSVPLMFLWNGVAVEAIAVFKPISYIQAVGLLLLATVFQSSFSVYFIKGQSAPEGEIRP